jgi:hypothetical protein
LCDNAQAQYQWLQQLQEIVVHSIPTYQGKIDDRGINGCCVISALVVAHHLTTSASNILPHLTIQNVIDNECGPILQEIRQKLSLPDASLITPSDAHDHLINMNILMPNNFLGAAGGSVLSGEHMTQFVELFQAKKRAGGVFFFHNHVVSIIKTPLRTQGDAFYNLIDSMPTTTDPGNNPCASCTCCKNTEALRVLLNWYVTKKFSSSDCIYIDNNDWNESTAEAVNEGRGDPRVFQGFVWGV